MAFHKVVGPEVQQNWVTIDIIVIKSQSSNLYAYLNGSLLGCKPSGASCRAKYFLYVFAVSLAKSRENMQKINLNKIIDQ